MSSWGNLWRNSRRVLTAAVSAPALALTGRDQVLVERLPPFESRVLGESRTIDVFLPRDYATATSASYPVLYANDGQDMQAVELAATLDSLQRIGAMRPVLVVAIHATARLQDYGTAGTPNAQGLGTRAALYERFLLEELMPAIEAHYRVAHGPTQTAVMGWSLGALSAMDLAWRHPDRVGSVGAFSGAFWWRTNDTDVAARQSSRIMHRLIRETAGHPPLRFWFETGLQDESADRDADGVIDAIQDTEELVLELTAHGYKRGPDLVHLTVTGRHDLPTWQRMLPEFLLWAFPR
ncbi:MAG: alpha/beta hydrolase-fold protein [Gemmatimonadales bacterium]